MPGCRACCVVFCLGLLAAPETGEPLRLEDVVRLHVSGASAEEIVELVLNREVDFDLSEEMLEELRLAGLPPAVLEAMESRQAEMDRKKPQPSVSSPDPGLTLTVLLNPEQKKAKKRRLRVYDQVDPQLAAELELRIQERRFADVGVFLACRTPDHVPDGWRIDSPLRWDTGLVPRHRMLAFASGARWKKAGFLQKLGLSPSVAGPESGGVAGAEVDVGRGKLGILELEIPPSLEVQVAPHVAHDLSVGIALKIGDRYYPWSISAVDGIVLEGQPLELEALLRGLGTLRLDLLDIDFAENGSPRPDAEKVCMRCPRD